MAEVFAPFIVNRTIRNLTFYVMEGRNFVRKKSSLTRRKVLYSPQFERTRRNAGLMAKASKIGSFVYNALPEYWRQGWMYRSFTGEAFTMLKAGKKEDEIQQVLLKRYVEAVVNKQSTETVAVPSLTEPKRVYRKLNTAYWQHKTLKSVRRKARMQLTLYYAGLMSRASKIGSALYAQLPGKYTVGHHYQYLSGLALKLLKQDISEEDILTELQLALPSVDRPDETNGWYEHAAKKKPVNVVSHSKGQYYFISSVNKRFVAAANVALPVVGRCTTNVVVPLFNLLPFFQSRRVPSGIRAKERIVINVVSPKQYVYKGRLRREISEACSLA